ncbi:MAG: hypothetical protein VX529_09585 [Pseudomonadota bacterium]|nr:hypothetical protein [Pseudomonadota bacterium]
MDTVNMSLELAGARPLDEDRHEMVERRLEWARRTLASVFPDATEGELRLAAAAQRLRDEMHRFEREMEAGYGASSPFLCALLVDHYGADYVLETGVADEIAGWARATARS